MFNRKKETPVELVPEPQSLKAVEEVAPTTVPVHVDFEVYSMSQGADRLRLLEAELDSAFADWQETQKSCAEKRVLVEFRMSEPLAAAWAAWNAQRLQQ